ncbi:hypothetical protein, partial [Enterobacter sichuanensis]
PPPPPPHFFTTKRRKKFFLFVFGGVLFFYKIKNFLFWVLFRVPGGLGLADAGGCAEGGAII